ncbi:hypothetical protein PROFUN_13396 [Planoprotostelium fungivorum]|uniref:Integrase catalytic domain-containing protein n=1 Tax=Planoprotostelium fungivorum TaxID=1890364 RepID=A0A2P6N3Q4_9EUKA|nr:hypothetical protein PROFUN_13396 [Planoprotostelium fungivorum]
MHRDKRIKTVPSLTEYLLSIWLDPSTTSNSLEGLFRSASRHNSIYNRHLGFNLQYKQQKHTVVPRPLVKWQMDLADMQNSAEYNNDTNYLLTIIDVFSKYALVCADHGIHQLTSFPYTPLGIIERFNKTIKQKIVQYLSIHVYYKYLNDKNNPIIPETIHFARGDKEYKLKSHRSLHLNSRENYQQKQNHWYQIGLVKLCTKYKLTYLKLKIILRNQHSSKIPIADINNIKLNLQNKMITKREVMDTYNTSPLVYPS